jgi:hypothetical protein
MTYITRCLGYPRIRFNAVWIYVAQSVQIIEPPLYFYLTSCTFVFQAFSYLGFVVAVVWIYSIANEIVNILQVNTRNTLYTLTLYLHCLSDTHTMILLYAGH